MLKKLLSALGIAIAATPAAQPLPSPAPYGEPAVNLVYNLLFCDDRQLFRPADASEPEGPFATLLAVKPAVVDLRALAEDESGESRLRALAYNRLREMGQPVAPKKLLGVILEVGLAGGPDVLAAFSDGRVRYINHTGKMAIFESAPADVAARVRELLEAARPVVERTGPWEGRRLPPPPSGAVRLTFLVSDGLYFGQGPFAPMRRDRMAGPVIAAGERLLTAVVESTTQKQEAEQRAGSRR